MSTPSVAVTPKSPGKHALRTGRDKVKPATDADIQTNWWIGDKEHAWERIESVTSRIEENMAGRRRQMYLANLAYQDVDPSSIYSFNSGVLDRTSDFGSGSRITLNVVQNAVDTLSSMVAKNRPKPLFLTDGADYKTRLKAEKLTKYVSGVIDDADVYACADRVFTDACVLGTGALKFTEEDNKIVCSWVFMGEILVDDIDAMRENPTQIHQRRYMNRDQLVAMFPKLEAEINKIQTGQANSIGGKAVSDMVCVTESWHLRSSPKAGDGIHSIIANGVTLLWEPYVKTYYPIQFFRLYHSTIGFWGRGVYHAIGRIQRTINKILRTIDTAQDLMGVPIWMVPKTAMVNWDHLTSNDIGRCVEFFGDQAPTTPQVTVIPQEIYQHVWALEQRAYNIVGVNQNMAQGQKQPGVESAVGQREATDTAQGRFQVVSQRWEAWFTKLADVIVDMSKDLNDPEINVDDGGSLRKVSWKDVDMERDKFKITVYQVSGLPQTPQGKIETLSGFRQEGLIPDEWYMKLLDLPDLRSYTNMETATTELTMATIAKIKETSSYPPELKPIPQMNLAQAQAVAAKEMVLAKLQSVDDDTLRMIEEYLEDISYLAQGQASPETPPPGGMPAGAPDAGAPPPMGGAPPPPDMSAPAPPPPQ